MDYQPDSDDNEQSQWSLDKVHQKVTKTVFNLNENFTPQKSNKVIHAYHCSPQDHQKIGFGKTVISPKTPEQLQSNNCLKNSDIYKSKSIQASG